jgi:hypothetical protein
MSNYVLAFRARPDHTLAPGEEHSWATAFASLGSAIADSDYRVGATRTLPRRRPGTGPRARLAPAPVRGQHRRTDHPQDLPGCSPPATTAG